VQRNTDFRSLSCTPFPSGDKYMTGGWRTNSASPKHDDSTMTGPHWHKTSSSLC
jgi:hypothetical protein